MTLRVWPEKHTAAWVSGACVSVLLLSGVSASAQDRPPPYPTRDVAVTYTGGPGQPLHMAWLAAQHLERSDIAPGLWKLHNEAANAMIMVDDAEKASRAMPVADPTAIVAAASASYTKGGTDTIAGYGCTKWTIHTDNGDAQACITADGVAVRIDAAGTTLTASQVTYGPQDPARFRVPADYSTD